MISKVLSTLKSWVAGLWPSNARADVVAVLSNVSKHIDNALVVVKLIDDELKPALRNPTHDEPVIVQLEKFLIRHLDGNDLIEGRLEAQRLVYLAIPDILANVAVFLLSKAIPSAVVSSSILRLAIEFAYNVYKSAKK